MIVVLKHINIPICLEYPLYTEAFKRLFTYFTYLIFV